MHLLEKQGGMCACRYVFRSIDEMHPDHEDNSPNHNCARNFQRLLCRSCNTKKGIQYMNMVKQNPDLSTSWLSSDYSDYGFGRTRRASVCVPMMVSEHEVTSTGEYWRVREIIPIQPRVIQRAIIPRNRDFDSEDTDSSSQSTNRKNQPKYFLYFLLKVKLGHRFTPTMAKKDFALELSIPHGTIKNHYYTTMSGYFERDTTKGHFLNTRKPNVKPFLEESEIESMLRDGLIAHTETLKLYAETLDMALADLIKMIEDSPIDIVQ